jgi:hypothetical protein
MKQRYRDPANLISLLASKKNFPRLLCSGFPKRLAAGFSQLIVTRSSNKELKGEKDHKGI